MNRPGFTTKHLRIRDREMFHDYKRIAKRMTEYSKTPRFRKGGDKLTTTGFI